MGIKDEQGRVLHRKGDILKRWHEYATVLYQSPAHLNQQQEQKPTKGDEEPPVLKEEIRMALKRLKSGKAVGGDRVPAKAPKSGGETRVEVLKTVIDGI